MGLNAAYLPWSVPPAQLLDAVRGLRAMGTLLGANVTVPHKQAVVPPMERLTPETPFLVAARRRGRRAVNGLGILLHQGALAFERRTGRPAPRDTMRTALERSA